MSNRIGSLLFCERCGSLLNPPADDDKINCEECGLVENGAGVLGVKWVYEYWLIRLQNAAYENLNIETRSHPNAFPSALHLKKSLVVNTLADGAKATGAEVTNDTILQI